MVKRIKMAIDVLLIIVVALVAYRLAVSKVETDIYRDRLAGLSSDYESLRGMYNEAVARTAVTELAVKEGKLSVIIRTIQGVEKTIETPFDPAREIYCDYVVMDGRLWIRRVYDGETPPSKGLVVDDSLETVDWNNPAARYGKAVYRSLGEGRWVVTVTGDGSLGLAKAEEGAEVALSGPPPVRDYDEMKEEVNRELGEIGIADVIRHVMTQGE